MRAAKISMLFAIYTTLTRNKTIVVLTIPYQYKEFQFFLNANILLKHRPYDSALDLQNDAQLSFGPIYNFSQNEYCFEGIYN